MINMVGSEYIYQSRDGINHKIPDVPIMQYVTKDFEKHGENIAIVDGPSGRSYTYTQLQKLFTKCGSALTRKGFRQGDVLCIYSPNLPEYQIIVGAVLIVGGTVTTANPLDTVDELQTQFQNARPSFIVTIPELADQAKQVKRCNPGIKEVIVFGEYDGCTPFADLANDNGDAYPTNVHIVTDDVAYLLYSSGTTGLPKGVMLTHKNIVSNIFQSINTPEAWCFTPYTDSALAVLPFFHSYGYVGIALNCLTLGVKLVTLPRFEQHLFLKTLHDYKITVGFFVPPLILFLARHPMVDKYKLYLKDVICAAARLAADLELEFKKRLELRYIRQGYGLTETSPVLSMTRRSQYVQASSGALLCNTEARIVDLDSGHSLPPGQRGEVWVRGPQVMKGYFKNPEATANCIDKEGWFHTGDIGYFNKDGILFLVDRLKELIKYEGSQVPPAELEALLLKHPAVADVAVIGIPDEETGELPKAFVVLRAEQVTMVTENDLVTFVAERVAPHKKLRGGVEFVQTIHKSASGKILRRKLRDLEKERRTKTKILHSKL